MKNKNEIFTKILTVPARNWHKLDSQGTIPHEMFPEKQSKHTHVLHRPDGPICIDASYLGGSLNFRPYICKTQKNVWNASVSIPTATSPYPPLFNALSGTNFYHPMTTGKTKTCLQDVYYKNRSKHLHRAGKYYLLPSSTTHYMTLPNCLNYPLNSPE